MELINNSANNGGAILAVVNASVSFTGTSSFISNLAMQGGAISVNSNSKLVFNKSFTFTNNGHNTRGSCGGAMYLAISSIFLILPHTGVRWENNHACLRGAIYVFNANLLINKNASFSFLAKISLVVLM